MQKFHTGLHQIYLLGTTFGILLAIATFIASGTAKSPYKDKATPILSREISGKTADTAKDYFYTFVAGPGEVKVTANLKSASYAAMNVDLFDRDANLLGSVAVTTLGKNERAIGRIKLQRRQTVILAIHTDSTGIAGNFQVQLNGAVQLAAARAKQTTTK
jgi:hypothetical protein